MARLIVALVLSIPIAAGLAHPLPVERVAGAVEPAIWSAPSGPSPVPDRPDDPDAPARSSLACLEWTEPDPPEDGVDVPLTSPGNERPGFATRVERPPIFRSA
ncbi:MAG: hypothetical protein HYY06_19450 [Deltaproteobacteria bacterium]|nr:hypothetical protein [Deltaproteobacteria bacterium]